MVATISEYAVFIFPCVINVPRIAIPLILPFLYFFMKNFKLQGSISGNSILYMTSKISVSQRVNLRSWISLHRVCDPIRLSYHRPFKFSLYSSPQPSLWAKETKLTRNCRLWVEISPQCPSPFIATFLNYFCIFTIQQTNGWPLHWLLVGKLA